MYIVWKWTWAIDKKNKKNHSTREIEFKEKKKKKPEAIKVLSVLLWDWSVRRGLQFAITVPLYHVFVSV